MNASQNLYVGSQAIQAKSAQKVNENTIKIRNTGCWTKQQQNKYVQFISIGRKQLQTGHQRKYLRFYDRNHKIFKKMSEFIGSRDGIQCRSHHIKQLRTHKQISKIIEQHENKHGSKIQIEKRPLFSQNPSFSDGKNLPKSQTSYQERTFFDVQQTNSFTHQNYQFSIFPGLCYYEFAPRCVTDYHLVMLMPYFSPSQGFQW